MNTKSRLLMTVATGAFVLLPLITVASAAETKTDNKATSAGLEEIVVTAERRQASLQNVPIAVSAFTTKELELRQVNEPLQLIRFIPNMVGSNNTGLGTANVYSIRALNNTESISTFDPPVGTYVDDVYIARQNDNNFQFFDVERVEVLRGPQGTLFGRNTTGGAVNMIMRKPGTELGGYAEASYGRFNRYTARSSVDLPVNEKILTKISAYYVHSDGWVHDTTTGQKLNGEKSYGVRGAVRLLMSDAVTWDLAAEYVNSQRMDILYNFDPVTGERVSKTGMTIDGTPLHGLVAGQKQDFGLGNKVENVAFYSTLAVKTDTGTITSITGYRSLKQKFNVDFLDVGIPVGGYVIDNDGTHTEFTQELKAAGHLFNNKLDYVVGAFYMHEKNKVDFADLLFGNVLIDRTLRNKTESGAGYGQFDFHVTDELTATAGIRYTIETKDIDYQPNVNPRAIFHFNTSDIIAAGIAPEMTTKMWTPRFALQYKLTPDIMTFLSATRGFKSGGWNARGTSAALIRPFNPEKVWSYEAGTRTEWLDHRLRFNATVFLSEIKDFQLPAAYNNGGAITFITNNFADMEVYGLEAELSAVPVDRLNVYGSLGLQHAKYKNFNASIPAQQALCAGEIAAGGAAPDCGVGIVNDLGNIADPVRAPHVTVSFGANYEIPVTSQINLVPNAAIFYTGKTNVGTAGTPIGLVGGYTMVNASLSLEDAAKAWSLTAECTNCFGKNYVHTVLIVPYHNDPGTWTVRAKYKF